MSGRHPFSKLIKDFTPEERQQIEAMKAELRADILSRLAKNPPGENARDDLKDTLAHRTDPS